MPSVVFSNICSTRGLGFGAIEAGAALRFGDLGPTCRFSTLNEVSTTRVGEGTLRLDEITFVNSTVEDEMTFDIL